MTAPRPGARASGVAVAGLAAAAVVALFAVNVRERCFLIDDAYISFRYARHLAEGEGLVWNRGERVEGYTNFLWVVLMAAALELGGAPERVSNGLGIASGAALLAALVLFSARRRGWSDPFIWSAPLALAASRSFTAWCTGGLETMFFALLVFLGTAVFVEERRKGVVRPVASGVLFALAALTRPEGVIFAAAAGVAFGVDLVRGERRLRSALAWGLPLVVLCGGHLLWRQAYYGEWLPNTFYAKVPGAWWDQGLRFLALYHEDYRFAWFLPLLLPALALRRDLPVVLFASGSLLYLMYVAYVGGDRFEFRFLVPVLPGVYWLLSDSLSELRERAGAWPAGRTWATLFGLAVTVALLFATHAGSRRPEARLLRHGVTSIEAAKQYAEWRAREGRILRSLIDDGLLPQELVIAVTGAGALPYYTDWTTIDLHGLNDATIARLPLPRRGVVAHERSAPYEYLLERDVAVVDVRNRLLHSSDLARLRQPRVEYDGHPLPVVSVRARLHYLVFATPLSDRDLERAFPGLEIQR